MNAPRRGEVWSVSFNPTEGREQAGLRRALIISVDAFNTSGAKLVTVLAYLELEHVLTTTYGLGQSSAEKKLPNAVEPRSIAIFHSRISSGKVVTRPWATESCVRH